MTGSSRLFWGDGTNTRTVRIGYADNFNSSPGVTTYAYPTVISDPAASSLGDASHSSTVKYRYDIGANIEATSPAPAGQSHGKTTKRIFDSIGRLDKQSVYVNTIEQSYTRYEYPTSGIHSKAYATIVDTNSNGPDTADEVLSESWTDGAGRVRFSRVPHTFSGGSTATWAGTAVEYDMLGRVTRQSVPTEVNGSFEPTGDDATRGWLWNKQEYDWMGRTTRTIPTDSNGSDAKDTITTYEGCGCAGGLVTTVQGPLVPRDDDPETNARRTVKSYADILGRAFKTETYEWNGSTVYSSVLNTYNGRDQVTLSRQFAGTTSSTTYQDTTASYDGFGRLYQSHKPEQRDGSNNLKYTTYSYNPDDSIQTVTDGRGAVTNHTYNSRGLLTQKNWSVPNGSGIDVPATVNFQYDNAGNRTQMTDGLGTQTYAYDSLSRIIEEIRDFDDTLPDSPIVGGAFKLEYDYELSGNLRSLKDPYGQQFNYSHDRLGRLASVGGSAAFDGISTYAGSPTYNARNSLTGLSYGNGAVMSVTSFNDRLQVTGFEVTKGATDFVKKQYQYYQDGSVKFSADEINSNFDRLYEYDFIGRTAKARSGMEARGETANEEQQIDVPYRRDYGYDAFDHLTSFIGNYYTSFGYNYASFPDNREYGYQFDDNGNQLQDQGGSYKYDAAGRLHETGIADPDDYNIILRTNKSYFDGSGDLTKFTRLYGSTTPAPITNYYIRSTVLNKVVSESDATGKKLKTYIPADGSTLAEQSIENATTEKLTFIHGDPSGASVQQTDADGNIPNGSGYRAAEYDPVGQNVNDSGVFVDPISDPNIGNDSGIDLFGSAQGYRPNRIEYRLDGMPIPESFARARKESGRVGGQFGLLQFQAWSSTVLLGWRRVPNRRSTTPPRLTLPGEANISTLDTAPPNADAYADFQTNEGVVRNYYQAVYSDVSWASVYLVLPPQAPPPDKSELTKEKEALYTKALKEMATRLRKKNCYTALGFKSREEVEDFLKSPGVFKGYVDIPRMIEGSSPEQYTASVAITQGKVIAVNLYGGFFARSDGYVDGPEGKQMYLGAVQTFYTQAYPSDIQLFGNDNVYRAFVLLHEIAHYTGVGKTDGPEHSAKNISEQGAINDKVMNCFKSALRTDHLGVSTITVR